MRSLNATTLAIFLTILSFAGCGKESNQPGSAGTGSSKGGPKLAFITNNVSDFWAIAQKGVNKAERELGVKVAFKMPPNGTVEEQTKFLEDFLTLGYDAIAISPKDANNMTDLLNSVSAKTRLVCFDSDAPASKRLAYVGTNNYDAGKLLGEQLVKLFPNGGSMVVFVGTLDAQNAQDRYKGIKDVLKQHGDKIKEAVPPKLDEKDSARSKKNVEDVITAFPGIQALVGLWAYNGPDIASAVKAAGKAGKIKIVCFDEDKETLGGIRSGLIDATIVQDPFGFSYETVKLMKNILDKGDAAVPPGGTHFIPARVINKQNVEAFEKDLAEMTK